MFQWCEGRAHHPRWLLQPPGQDVAPGVPQRGSSGWTEAARQKGVRSSQVHQQRGGCQASGSVRLPSRLHSRRHHEPQAQVVPVLPSMTGQLLLGSTFSLSPVTVKVSGAPLPRRPGTCSLCQKSPAQQVTAELPQPASVSPQAPAWGPSRRSSPSAEPPALSLTGKPILCQPTVTD